MVCSHSGTKAFTTCTQCGEIFLPSTNIKLNYFEIFGIKPAYFIDTADVIKKFYELSRVLHPDRFQTKSQDSLIHSTHWSAVLNKAFNTLKDPEERAYYLFELANFTLEGKGSLPPDLAEDYFNLQEALEDDSQNIRSELEKFYGLLKDKILEIDSNRDAIFEEWERAHSPLDQKAKSFFTQAANLLQQKAYLRSMSQDLEKNGPFKYWSFRRYQKKRNYYWH